MDLIIIIIPSKSVRDDKTGQIGRSLCGTKKKKDQTCGKSRRIISSISSIFLKVEKMEKKITATDAWLLEATAGPGCVHGIQRGTRST